MDFLEENPEPKKRETIQVDGVYDIETCGWDEFVVGAILTRAGFRVYWWEREGNMVADLLEERGFLWAHNGGKYDVQWLLRHVAKRGMARQVKLEVGLAGQRLVRVEANDVVLRDSFAIVPLSLAKASKMSGREKKKTGLQCECGKDCGGYCAIRKDMSTPQRKLLTEYLEEDCRATLALLDWITDYAETNDLDLAGTIGMSAWKSASRLSPDVEPADWKDERGSTRIYSFVREGYFGGRCQVFRKYANSGHRYDINSAYPAALSLLELPCGERKEKHGKRARWAYDNGYEGVFAATVDVPECFVPPLPIRLRHRIAYPWGRLAGTWTGLELRYAESVGVKILKVRRAVVWRDRAPLLSAFCKYVWSLRDEAGPKTPLGTWLKLYANSLTGKFAQNPEVERVEIDPESPKLCPADFDCRDGWIHTGKRCCKHECTRRCGKWTPISMDQLIWGRPIYSLSGCSHVEWAAYLTAWTRTILHAQIIDDGQGGRSACMTDTDCVVACLPRTKNIGDALGQWKYEGPFREFVALAPKTYSFVDPRDGKRTSKAKGIPNADENWQRIAAGLPVSIDRGILTFKSAARSGNLFQRKNYTRAVRPDGIHYGDRIARRGDDKTWPQHISALLDDLRRR